MYPRASRGEPRSYALVSVKERTGLVVPGVAIPYGAEVVLRSPPPAIFSLTLAAATACAVSDMGRLGDREHYVAALAEGAEGPRLEHCVAIQSDALQGDCLTALVAARAIPADITATGICDRIRDGAWRDECAFAAAELALAAGDPGLAADRCMDAGRYAKNCTAHLWQTELRAAMDDAGIEALLGERLAITEIHDRWSQHLGPGVTFEEVFWQNCYRMAFERAQHLEVSACERVPSAERDACLRGAVTTYRNWLHHSPTLRDGKNGLCAAPIEEMSLEEASALLVIPTTDEHPQIARVLRGFHAAVCRDGKDLIPHRDALVNPRSPGGAGRGQPSGASRPSQ